MTPVASAGRQADRISIEGLPAEPSFARSVDSQVKVNVDFRVKVNTLALRKWLLAPFEFF